MCNKVIETSKFVCLYLKLFLTLPAHLPSSLRLRSARLWWSELLRRRFDFRGELHRQRLDDWSRWAHRTNWNASSQLHRTTDDLSCSKLFALPSAVLLIIILKLSIFPSQLYRGFFHFETKQIEIFKVRWSSIVKFMCISIQIYTIQTR